MSDQMTTKGNRLLDELPSKEVASLMPDLKLVMLEPGQILSRAEFIIEDVYFPTSGLVLLLKSFENGVQAEVGLVGQEGMIGQSVASNIDNSFPDVVVQLSGAAFQMSTHNFKEHFRNSPQLRSIVSSYQNSIYAQLMQSAACNACHSLEQRLSRLLLTIQDRVGRADLLITQAALASMLSVQRPSVTIVAILLQRAGFIRYSHGRIMITNRENLLRLSCECYKIISDRSRKKLSRVCA